MKFSIYSIALALSLLIDVKTPLQEVHFSAKGTGQTTGHIIDLTVENKGTEHISLDLGPYFIPAKTTSPDAGDITAVEKTHQSYVTGGPFHVEVPPGETVTVPIQGYCTNIQLPPVPKGEDPSDYSAWINLGTDMEIPLDLIESAEWERGKTRALNPFTGASLPGYIDFEQNPETVGPIIHKSVERITTTVDSLYAEDAIRTPFANKREKERQTIIQQTLWVFTSALAGQKYTREQFRERLEDQVLTRLGMTYEDLPEQDQEHFDSGTETFWNTFDLVGTESKIILTSNPEDDDIRIPTPEIEDEPKCDISPRVIVDPPMEGGLRREFKLDEERIKRDDFIALGAEGRDYDQLEWICKPIEGCKDSEGKKKIPLTGKVKFSWDIIEGEGQFVRLGCLPRSGTEEGDHVIFQPPYVSLPENRQPNRKRTVILLKIIDDNPTQPTDETVERRITITTERRRGRISAHHYFVTVEAENYTLPSAPDVDLTEGTCRAVGPDWDAPNDLSTAIVKKPTVQDRDKMVVGQWIRLHAEDQTDNDKLKLECTSNNCQDSKQEDTYEDDINWKWRINSRGKAGSFVTGGESRNRSDEVTGRYVIYEAPGEIDEDEPFKDVEIEVEVSDREGQQKVDNKPEKRKFVLRIYKAGIALARTPTNWLPEKDNRLDLLSKLKYYDGQNWLDPLAHMCRIHYFELVESSREKGYCTNAPNEDAEQCFDLRFKEENEHEVFNEKQSRIRNCDDYRDYMMEARTQRPEREYTISVHSEDYGSYGKIVSHGNINEHDPGDQKRVKPVYTSIPVEANDHPQGRNKDKVYEDNRVTIPRDIDENHIADHGWRAGVGNARQADPADITVDEDSQPVGDGFQSDGYTAYEEYRGFEITAPNEGHVRTDLNRKDLMVWNEGEFNLTLFRNQSGLIVHEVGEDHLWHRSHRYWSNYNSNTFRQYQQAGIKLVDGGFHSNLRGIALTMEGVDPVAPPNWTTEVRVYSRSIRQMDLVKGGFISYSDKANQVTAHEMAHAVNTHHHGEGTGSGENINYNVKNGPRSGNHRCIMRYDNRQYAKCQKLPLVTKVHNGKTYKKHPEPIGSIYCTGSAGTGYNAQNKCFGNCAQGRGNCKRQFRVSGRASNYPKR